MIGNFTTLLRKKGKKEQVDKSKEAAKERLHLVLMQDRANVSADFLEMMKQEIVDVVKKYIDVDEKEMDVKLESRTNDDGTSGTPSIYANIPIIGINEEKKKESEELVKAKQEAVEEKKKVTRTKTTKTATKSATKTAVKKTATKAKKTTKASADKGEEKPVTKTKKTTTVAKKSVEKK